MRRTFKIGLYTLGGLAATAVVLVVAALIVVQSAWFHEKVRQRMVREIEDATGGRVELGSFDFDWRTMTVTVRNLVIHGTEGPQEAPFARVDLVRLELKVISALEQRVDLLSALVERPQVNVIVYPDGHTNVPQPKAAAKPRRDTIESVLDLAIKRFNVVDGAIQAGVRRIPLAVRGENLRAAVVYQAGPARYEGDLTFRDLDVKLGARPALPIEVDTHWALLRDRLEIRRARFGLGESWVYVSGVADRTPGPLRFRLDYSARVGVKDVTPGLDLGPLAHRGTISLDGHATIGDGSRYGVSGKLRAAGLVVESGGIRIEDVRTESAFTAAPGRVTLTDLAVAALGGRFTGRVEIADFRHFLVEGVANGFSLQQMKLIQEVRQVAWDGIASGPVRLSAEVRNRRIEELELETRLDIAPGAGPNPIQGLIDLNYNLAAHEVDFGPSNLATKFSHVAFSGALGKRLSVALDTTNGQDVETAIAMFSAGPAPEMPLKLVNGSATFQGAVTGPLASPAVEGHLKATNFVVAGRQIDRAEADVAVGSTGLAARHASVSRLGMRASGDLRLDFQDWKPTDSSTLSGNLALRSPHLADVLAAAGVAPSDVTTGDLSLNLELAGTLGAPVASGHARALKVVAAGQPIDRVEGDLRTSATQLDLLNAQFTAGAGKVQLSGSYDHPKETWRQGLLRFEVNTGGIDLALVKAVADRVPGIEGKIEAQAAGEITFTAAGFQPAMFNGQAGLRDFGVSGERLGNLALTATTHGHALDAKLEGSLAGSTVTGTSAWTLEGDYPAHGRIDFTPLQFSTLIARLHPKKGGEPLPFEGFAAGSVEFSGSASNLQSWRATVNLPSLQIQPAARLVGEAQAPGLTLRNAGAVLMEVDTKGVHVRQAHFQAKDTDVNASGNLTFGVRSPWDLRVQGAINLALLEDFESRMYASGSVGLDVSLRGELSNPEVYGRIDLKNASVSFVDFPNGFENANGEILLYRDRATIQTLTAQSGGGRIDVSGFVSLADGIAFHLQAKTTNVRVRYPQGISSTSNASVTFTGTPESSLLAGNATVTRVGLSLQSDLGSMLASSAQPVSAPLEPSRFRQGLRFDLHIVTAPQVRVETNVAKEVEVNADLRLRGDDARPVLLGRVLLNQGQVNFFGTQYAINSGQILFVNATKIEPTMNLSLETRVRGVSVTLHISGPMDKLNMSYTSDPPLPFGDVLALLTTGREPGQLSGTTPTASALVGQSYQQGGASALLSQAIGSPLTGRLQRFFGVSRLKINPLVTGLTTSNAAAQVTLEQNITNNLTFTYISDLSRAQAQTIQMEWDFTPNWSGLAVREENGLFGIDFLYKKQIK
ncbi:MAG TPA: translocation/assembly module TamB domain-containing protein [Bryobacteraceae bacterium]|nr:translocation/assembly module TamB domain-containing protein [Bryobacteraceae bacterium]